jgi:ubiquinone/menaquinone biosynthesis C-methylase UbiE
MNNENTENILLGTEKGYDLIADKFSSTRAFMWRELGLIKGYVRSGDKVLDFGCGNGRLAGFLENNYGEYVGVDISQKLLNIAKQRYNNEKTEFIKIGGQAAKPPFKDNHFDVIFSIAVFHHFPSKEYSLKMAKELYRILRPGGKIVITAWNLWQKQYLKFHQKTSKSWLEASIPFKAEEKVFNRYHHPFKIGELKNLFQEAGFETLKAKEGRNLLYIGIKSDVDKGD